MPKLVMTDIPYKVDSYPTKPPASRIIGLAAMNPNFMAPAVRTMFNHIVDKYQENEFKNNFLVLKYTCMDFYILGGSICKLKV